MKKHLIHLISALFALALGFVSCSGGSDNNGGQIVNQTIYVTGVSLNKTEMTLDINTQETLVAAVQPANATNRAVSWASSDTGVATVANGTVTALNPGTANITVTTQDGGRMASCVVTVTSPVLPIGTSLSKNTMTLVVGATETLTAIIQPSNATTNNAIRWESLDTNIATVSDSGIVTAHSPGFVSIRASVLMDPDPNKGSFCHVVVVADPAVPATGVSLNKNVTTIKAGGQELLIHTVLPSIYANQNVAWSSDNTAIATVEGGFVSAVAAGTATITATTVDGGHQASCNVTITTAGPDVWLSTFGRLRLYKNGSVQGGYPSTHAFFVSGDDLYVLGSYEFRYSIGTGHTHTLWKNGVPQPFFESLVLPYGTLRHVRKLFVSDGDVYVAGQEYKSDPDGAVYTATAKLWKNGVEQSLMPTSGYRATDVDSLFVSGNDVYVGGWEQTDGQEDADQVIWKNGAVLYKNAGRYVFVDGDDVYSTGNTRTKSGIYKNGEPQHFDIIYGTSGYATLRFTSIFVSNGDCYVTGSLGFDGMEYVTLWKNGRVEVIWSGGVELFLNSSGISVGGTYGTSVFVHGNDVYVAGVYFIYPTGNYDLSISGIGKLWKNGVDQLNLGYESPMSIFVK